jgi:hypothetical protein
MIVHITKGKFGVMFDADPADGTIQHLLTLGLDWVLAIACLKDAHYSKSEKFFNPDHGISPENDDFLHSALIPTTVRAHR